MTQPSQPAPVVTNGAIVAGGSPAVTSSASLAAQAALAASFYAAQAWLAVAATRDILQIWQALNLRDVRQSWPALRTALAALIRDRHAASAAQAARYYRQARLAAGVRGVAPVITLEPLPEPLITATLDSTGPYGLLGRIKQGQPLEQANDNTAVTMSGAASRLIQNGSRQVMLESVKADPEAVGWMRVTSANPCAWCALMASRGVVYRTAKSAGFEALASEPWRLTGFEAHNHCRCEIQAVYSREHAAAMHDNPLYQQWQQATKGKSGKDALRAWRQYWDTQQGRDGVRVLPAA